MALLERLQILIDADGKGLVREFDKAGAAADRLDAKLEKGSAKTSARLTSIGTKAAIGGAVVIGGLFKLAQASEEAELQQLKLENSIKNSSQAFKNNGKGLSDLATGLQQVTAADGDAIVGAESLLVQMGLTEEQVKTVTPLVVDLSRKLGIDLDQAAKMVGKSIGGSATALKKAGIDIDGARLKTDAFGATVDALAGSVGGFARQEGQTFAGQVAILKNNLGDLGESVGKGAAGVFGALAGDAAKAAGAINNINPAILETVGAVGATGGFVATLSGGFAFAAGKALQFSTAVKEGNTALVKVGDDGARSLTKVGKAAAGIAIVSAVVGVIETVATISNSINQVDKKGRTAFDGFRGAINGTSADLADAFSALVEVEDKSAEFAGLWEGFGTEISLGGFKADIEEVQAAFDKVLDTFGPEAAQKTIDGLRSQNEALDKNSDQYQANADFIAENQTALDKRRKALTEATVAERAQKRATQESVAAYDRQSSTLEGVNQEIQDYNDQLAYLVSSYESAQKGAKAFGDQIERSTSIDNIAGSAVKLSGALRTLNADLTNLPSFDEALDPTRISEGAGQAVDALLSYGSAVTTYFQTVIGAGGAELVPELAEKYRNILTTALQNAGVNPADIPDFIKLAGLDDESVTVAVKFAKDQASIDKLKLELELFAAELSNDPKATAFIKAAIAQGNFDGAQKFFETWAANNPINVPVIPTPGTSGSYTVTVAANSSGGTSGNQRDRSGRRRGAPRGEAPSPPSASLPPGRASGGPVALGMDYMVNERGPEIFVPRTDGFVLNSAESGALVRGVQQLLSNGGGNTFNITSSDPMLTAAEVVRRQRDAQFLLGR